MPFAFDTSYKTLDSKLYSTVTPSDFDDPEILLLDETLCDDLGIDSAKLSGQVLSGQDRLEDPIAQAYAGHQFGTFTILGDGRAMILGEHVHDGDRYDIQLKGAGRTPYSGRGDGKATVSSMLREFLYSYAMYNLGINSSRSLAVLETDDTVERRQREPGAILVRVMKSHIRFGTFQYVAARPPEELAAFTDYVIDRHYPELADRESKYVAFFEAVMEASIEMVIDWLRVGFIHGVMNTDNMSITGATFDYGPCAFMNYYNEDAVFSSVDNHGRYAFGNQRQILQWNLARFAESLQPLCENSAVAFDEIEAKLDSFEERFEAAYYEMMRQKLGNTGDGAAAIVDDVLEWLRTTGADYTNTFLELENPDSFDDSVYSTVEFEALRERVADVGLDEDLMQQANPRYIPRNYMVENALTTYVEENDLARVNALLSVLTTPYEAEEGKAGFQEPPPREYDAEYKTYCNT